MCPHVAAARRRRAGPGVEPGGPLARHVLRGQHRGGLGRDGRALQRGRAQGPQRPCQGGHLGPCRQIPGHTKLRQVTQVSQAKSLTLI